MPNDIEAPREQAAYFRGVFFGMTLVCVIWGVAMVAIGIAIITAKP